MATTFVDRFRHMAVRAGRRQVSTPFAVLEQWETFVDDCREGYDGTLYEYRDELSVRRFLQGVLDDPVVRDTPEIEWFAAEVARIDAKFRELLGAGHPVPGGTAWWDRAVPGLAGEDMAQNIRSHFGIEVEIC
ncbi:hypothetical protein [Streptomyces sp. BK239]|uniref:hypothetical protein n=1 Tax=Streptomyces sp. BK239 TaxID=2512155 RepID=UPI00102BE49E|nr:hypothetical protein [Streptomyces sp. BK239]RZU25079.1 hypothetical protein EV567_0561 [Streptomyces sp. BK239]